MKQRYRQIITNIKIALKEFLTIVIVLFLIFPFSVANVMADPVPVEEVGRNLQENIFSAEILGEIIGPIYQLATPGSNLSYDIYRYLMKHTENELGIDKDFFRRMQRKQPAPTVDIVFAPTNPKVGEKVTAFAIPRNFRNSKDKLYFTWYIVHDGERDVTAGRDEAAKIVARGGYDKNLFGEPKTDDGDRDAYNASSGGDNGVGKKSGRATKEDCEGCKCLHDMTMFAGQSDRGCFDDQGELLYLNNDEYKEAIKDRGEEAAKIGRGVVNSEWISRCYRHNFGRQSDDGAEYSGRDMIVSCNHAFNESLGGSDNSFDAGAEEEWGTNSENPDTDGDGVVDEADLVGLGQDEFTWIYRKGDKVSVAVEGTSNIPINEGSTNRLRYKNKKWDGENENLDLSPTASPEQWYKDARQECLDSKHECVEGGGLNCVPEYINCMEDLWEHERKEENDEDSLGKLTGYYKIMWAAPGICAKEDMDQYENDWCDTNDDLGFQYLKLYDPVEKSKQLLEVSLSISPKNPQFQEPDPETDVNPSGGDGYGDATDLIVASADVVSDDNVDPDYLYYKWSIWQCDPENVGKNLDNCEDVTNMVEFKSQREGVGIRDIGFYPKAFLMNKDQVLLKVAVIVKRHKNSVMSSPGINGQYEKYIADKESVENYNNEKEYPNKYAYTASKLIKVVNNKFKIKLYNAIPTGGTMDLVSTGWQRDKLICTGTGNENRLYKNVCPVYPYQVLMAELEGDADSVIWKVNGKIIRPTYFMNDNNNQEGGNNRTVFFPIVGQENELGVITAIVQKENNNSSNDFWGANNFKVERVFSIHNPMIKVIDKNGSLTPNSIQRAFSGTQGKRTLQNKQLWWMLGYPTEINKTLSGNSQHFGKVDIAVKPIPSYLQDEIVQKKLKVVGKVNNRYVGDSASRNNTRLTNDGVVFSGVDFEKNIAEENNDFTIQTIKKFDDNYRFAMQHSFGITIPNELYNQQDIVIKAISPEKYQVITGRNVNTLGFKVKTNLFFASVITKVPEYFILFIQLAFGFVLMTMISFGMIYGVGIGTTRK